MSFEQPPSDDSSVWLRLLREVESRIDALADEFVAELVQRGLYRPGIVEQEELRATAVESFTAIVRRLMAPDSSRDVAVLASSLGARRAAQGVALDALTEAVRLDLLVLWRQLRVLAGEEHRGLLVDRFDVLLRVLDEYVGETQLSFLQTRAQLELEGRLATERVLAQLFGSPALTASQESRIGQELGLSLEASLFLAGFRNDPVTAIALSNFTTAARSGVHHYALGEISFVLWSAAANSPVEAKLTALPGVRISVPALSRVKASADSLRELLQSSSHLRRLTDAGELWPAIAAQRMNELIPGFSADVLSRLEALQPDERDRLLSTVRTYLETGSVKETASRLFCHRNTVVNRLALFRSRTGLDLAKPSQAARTLVALAAT